MDKSDKREMADDGDLPEDVTSSVEPKPAMPKPSQQKEKDSSIPRYILPLIVFSQFAGTSLWFAGNAVLSDLRNDDKWSHVLSDSSLSLLTSAVQLGFIVGTLASALTHLADRVRPATRIFGVAACAGALVNAVIPLVSGLPVLLALRFVTGCTLAGIYPVGMKVAADWFQSQAGGLGQALGYLVGALVLGTAFPFVLRAIPQSWEALLYETSILAAVGGLLLATFGVPPSASRQQQQEEEEEKTGDPSSTPSPRLSFHFRTLHSLFAQADFRAAALGYWGHMWELYAFWTWLPVVWEALLDEEESNASSFWDEDTLTFVVIAAGAVGCVLGGYLSQRWSSAAVATCSLALSGACCLVSPLLFQVSRVGSLVFYLLWGMAVAADSPQFSTCVATTAPPQLKGTALTLVNCIGFTITIGSIQLLGGPWSPRFLYLWLAPGPLVGVLAMWRGFFRRNTPVVAVDGQRDPEQDHNDDDNDDKEKQDDDVDDNVQAEHEEPSDEAPSKDDA